jgi:uncharacterized protein
MNQTQIRFLSKPDLKSPIVIEGLPGIGLVGKIAADYLLSQMSAKKFCSMYSPFFPPQVVTDKRGIVRLVNNEFYHFSYGGQDYIILAGDFQGMSPESQYEITGKILDVLEGFKPKIIYTLGGLGTGRVVKSPKVYGATNNPKLIAEHKKAGIIFTGREGGGIFGASGLILGIGELRKMDAVCLMGETVGQLADAKAAKVMLDRLAKLLGIKIDMKGLNAQAKNTEKELKKVQQLQEEQTKALQMSLMGQQLSEDDTSSYIR